MLLKNFNIRYLITVLFKNSCLIFVATTDRGCCLYYYTRLIYVALGVCNHCLLFLERYESHSSILKTDSNCSTLLVNFEVETC